MCHAIPPAETVSNRQNLVMAGPGESTATHEGWLTRPFDDGSSPEAHALVIAWSLAEPERSGEVVGRSTRAARGKRGAARGR
jgi:hypothetical protein